MGGPLSEGDIEDFGGQSCVTCPWHGHKASQGQKGLCSAGQQQLPLLLIPSKRLQISLESGGSIEKGLMNTVCESAPKQRLHEAIDKPDGLIYVRLNDLRSLPSDKYNSNNFAYAKPCVNGFGLQHTSTALHSLESESRAFLGMTGGHQQLSEDDDPMSLSQTDSEASEYTSMPSPLMPFAGFNRSPISSSPIKKQQVIWSKLPKNKLPTMLAIAWVLHRKGPQTRQIPVPVELHTVC